ncbi:ketopantoate reductase family protein [Bradyrhizobium sp. Ce-3]|uniref:ketopantoate reductase family protein n=1 Tax=Bradyrhizobium sp. Ce-3 TaxID=2913970 RepID=UPI001FC8AADD|nr:ketopantoate reductase family protein [Bradyrhizobium sp. Ce-3]GKQ55150.1 2-dehydropantoate 2-reductase [Bradyrhizobium sp. Ce-3]
MSDQQLQQHRIAILGSGAMGSLFGGCLFEGGSDVTLIDLNIPHVEAIRMHGLELSTDSGRRFIRVPALLPHEVTTTFDLIIVFTKAMHTTTALSAVRSCIGPGTVLLSLQNGLDNKLALTAFARPQNVLIGMTTYPADLVAPGHVGSHGTGVARLAAIAEPAAPILAQLPDLLARGGLNATVDPQVETAIWEKVAFNAALNTLCALTRSTVGEIGRDPITRGLAIAIAAEVCKTAIACGFAVNHSHVEQTLASAMHHHTGHKPSMLQDVLAGKPTEIEAICGTVVGHARQRGISTPITDTVLTLIRHIDSKIACNS